MVWPIANWFLWKSILKVVKQLWHRFGLGLGHNLTRLSVTLEKALCPYSTHAERWRFCWDILSLSGYGEHLKKLPNVYLSSCFYCPAHMLSMICQVFWSFVWQRSRSRVASVIQDANWLDLIMSCDRKRCCCRNFFLTFARAVVQEAWKWPAGALVVAAWWH